MPLKEKKEKQGQNIKSVTKETPVKKSNVVEKESLVYNKKPASLQDTAQTDLVQKQPRKINVREENPQERTKDVDKELKKKKKINLEEALKEVNKMVENLSKAEDKKPRTVSEDKKGEERAVKEETDRIPVESQKDKQEEIEDDKEEEVEKEATNDEQEEVEREFKNQNINTENESTNQNPDSEKKLRTMGEILAENETLRKENMELKEEMKKEDLEEEDEEEEDDDDDDDDDDEEDEDDKIAPRKNNPETSSKMAFKDEESYPSYNVDLDVLVETYDAAGKDEWDQYFDELEHKKSREPEPEHKAPRKGVKKVKKEDTEKEPDSYLFHEEDYPLYNVDLDVLVDSFEVDVGDEWTKYFDRLEAEEDRKLDEKMKKKDRKSGSETGSRKGGGSFFAAGMPMKDDSKARVKEFIESERQRRDKGKHKFDKESIREYVKEKLKDKEKNDEKSERKIKRNTDSDDDNRNANHNDETRKDTKKKDDSIKEIDKKELEDKEILEKVNSNTESKQQPNQESSSVLQETLQKLVNDIEKLLSLSGNSNKAVQNGVDPEHKEDTKELEKKENPEEKSKATDSVKFKKKDTPKEEPKADNSEELDKEDTPKEESKATDSEDIAEENNNPEEKSGSIFNGEPLNLLPKNVDLTDPESIVKTIQHTTDMANKIMQDFADALTAQLLDGKTEATPGEGDEDDDEPWEAMEERAEKLQKLCKKGRLSSADCNQVCLLTNCSREKLAIEITSVTTIFYNDFGRSIEITSKQRRNPY